MGVASNLLVRDGGIDGVVVRFGGPLARVAVEGDLVLAGAGALDQRVAQEAQRAGLGGLEFLIGIPGTVGGAVRMNAGAFGGETKDRLVWAEALDRQGGLHRLTNAELGFAYRRSALPPRLDRGARRLPGRAGRSGGDPGADERDPGRARGGAAAAGRDRRQHLQEPAGPQGLAADRRRRLPRPAPGCGHGLGEALQLPDQHRRRQRRRGRAAGRAGAPARARAQRRRARVGGRSASAGRRAWSWPHDAGTSRC